MKNDVFLKALRREPVPYTPIWVMRQAGRYLPEYLKVREKAGSFMNLCQNPELACEVTLQPLRRFDLDAAILFSDILTIPDALGLGLDFVKGEGPKFAHPIRCHQDITKLAVQFPDDKLSYVSDAIKLIKHELKDDRPLIGFSGSPWTLACYMIQGQGARDFPLTKKMLYGDRSAFIQLIDKITHHVTAYIAMQIAAGVDVVMIFDTWGGLLMPEDYRSISLNAMRRIIDTIPSHIPSILFTKGGGQWLEQMVADTNVSALGLDWRTDIGDAFDRVGEKVALQGNLDPQVLLASPDVIRAHVIRIKEKVAGRAGHVFNLGHGITPEVPIESMSTLVQAVKQAPSF